MTARFNKSVTFETDWLGVKTFLDAGAVATDSFALCDSRLFVALPPHIAVSLWLTGRIKHAIVATPPTEAQLPKNKALVR